MLYFLIRRANNLADVEHAGDPVFIIRCESNAYASRFYIRAKFLSYRRRYLYMICPLTHDQQPVGGFFQDNSRTFLPQELPYHEFGTYEAFGFPEIECLSAPTMACIIEDEEKHRMERNLRLGFGVDVEKYQKWLKSMMKQWWTT